MLKVAIFSEKAIDMAKKIQEKLQMEANEKKIILFVYRYHSAEQCLIACKTLQMDVAFLEDTLNENCFLIADEIKKKNESANIYFFSPSTHYARIRRGFLYNAVFYFAEEVNAKFINIRKAYDKKWFSQEKLILATQDQMDIFHLCIREVICVDIPKAKAYIEGDGWTPANVLNNKAERLLKMHEAFIQIDNYIINKEYLCKINEQEIYLMNNHIYHCTDEEISILRQYMQRIGIPCVYGMNKTQYIDK